MSSRFANRPIPPTPLRQSPLVLADPGDKDTTGATVLSGGGSSIPSGNNNSYAARNQGSSVISDGLAATALDVGTKIWLEDKKHLYRLYGITGEPVTGLYPLILVTSSNDQSKATRSNKSELMLDVNTDKYYRSNPHTKADLTLLPIIHDPGILHNIHSRCIKQQALYTFATTNSLFSLTPSTKSSNIKERPIVMEAYNDRYSTGRLM